MRRNVSRSLIEHDASIKDVVSLGASYIHIRTLKGMLGPSTERVVMQHACLESFKGFEATQKVQTALLAFNRISRFRPQDASLPRIVFLDLAGNPLESLLHCPPCDTLNVSATRIRNLRGCPEGVRVLRCGHSTHLVSLDGLPSSVELLECSCAPNLILHATIPSHVREFISDRRANL